MIVCINQECQLILLKVLKNSEKHGFKCRYFIWIIRGYCSKLKLMNYRYGMILITNMHCIHLRVYFKFLTSLLIICNIPTFKKCQITFDQHFLFIHLFTLSLCTFKNFFILTHLKFIHAFSTFFI